ncbi:MAG: nucleotidyltransferase domain-containing protein [bacterium]|nr:nucleotidyltransferase domain-containing protein [bacterium]
MKETQGDTIGLTREEHAVYSCICYFNIFHYPMKPSEICDFANVKVGTDQIMPILQHLISLGLAFENQGYYSIKSPHEQDVKRRIRSEQRCLRKQKIIRRFALFISRFPYVESVSISGSCSKGLLDEEGDVDYFIITSAGRLWFCRSFLIAFKKICLLNSKKYFCLNYFVDADNLEIPDRNIFVASEIKTLKPISNKALFEKFLQSNAWADEFLPNKVNNRESFLRSSRPRKFLFRWVEIIFNNRIGSAIDDYCFHLTYAVWKKKFRHLNTDDFDLNFRSKKNVSKHHPGGFQKKVLGEMGNRLQNIKVLS